MKRIILFAVIIVTGFSFCFGQEETEEVLKSKKGIPILPPTGSWAIGIDASPIFRYVGNIFSTNVNSYVPSFGFTAQTPGAIYVKHKITPTKTYRFVLLIGVSNETVNEDDNIKRIYSAIQLGLTAGVEKSKELFGRMVGVYGLQAGVMKTPYNIGGGHYGKLNYKNSLPGATQYIETGGNTFGVVLGGFVGIEYFIAPRVALAGEFGLDLVGYLNQKREYQPSPGTNITQDYGGSGVQLSPTQSGNLQLLFYF